MTKPNFEIVLSHLKGRARIRAEQLLERPVIQIPEGLIVSLIREGRGEHE